MRSHSLVHAPALPPEASRANTALHLKTPTAAPIAHSVRFIGRVVEAEAALGAVRAQDSSGAVIVGAVGVGKTALLHHVQRSLVNSYVVRVRGLRSATSFPYRALSFLLSEVPGAVTHPALVLSAVGAYLREEADGRHIVFAIDNAEHLDRASSTLIGQLVAGNGASVIMTVADFAQADPAFMSLWRTGSLQRIDLAPFSFADTALFVASELGAQVSREGVEALWSVARGNAQATRAALQSFTQRGVLARRGQVWILLPERRGVGYEVVSTSPLLRTLTPMQRHIVDLVSLAGELSWKDLARLAHPAELDVLQDSGILVVLSDREPRVMLASPGLAEAVAEQVPADVAARLYQDLRSHPSAAGQLRSDPTREVGWVVRAGLPVDAERALAAVDALNRSGHHQRATELVGLLAAQRDSHRLTLEAMVAALGQGHLNDATAASATLTAAQPDLEREVLIRHLVEESRLRRVRAVGDPAAPLDQADEWLASWDRDPDSDGCDIPGLAGLRRRVRVARAELASFEGRYLDNLRDLEDARAADMAVLGDREERESQVALQSLLLEAMVLQSPTEEASGLAGVLVRNLTHPEVSHQVADAALLRVELAFLIAGSWGAVRRIFPDFQLSSTAWSPHRGSLADIATALDLVAEERAQEASRLLGPVVEQLRVGDRYGLLPLAAAILTYCHARTHPLDRGLAHLTLGGRAQSSPWVVRRATLHYQLLSQSLSGSRAQVARQMQERSADDLARGATMVAVVSLGSALRLGSTQAAQELEALCENCEGPLAEQCLLYARALRTADAGLVIRAVEVAAEAGDYRLAVDMATSGSDHALATDDRAAYRLIQRRLGDVLPERLRGGQGVPTLGLLTAREREIAAQAAMGSSNRAIAESMYVSVRTVEGHLYQVYSKLGVRTRAELADLFPGEVDS